MKSLHLNTSRRRFLRQSAQWTATAASVHLTSGLYAQSPNSSFSLGIIGPGGMGSNLLKTFAAFPDVHIAAVCDVDSQRLATAAKSVESLKNTTPKTATDLRRLLEDRSIDAVVIATPDHWHAPAAILACDAGKHVYVEKPGSHNIREGRLMIQAARRHRRIVQVGTQSRSSPHMIAATDKARSGAIGDVLSARVWNSQRRSSIGRSQPSSPPPHLDFDLWVGPAPLVPYRSNLLHGVWRWWFAFGTGDMGNDGVHDLDIGRWGLGVGDRHPNRVTALGGKYFFDDDQEFPDTQTVVFEYDEPTPSPAPSNQASPRLKTKQLLYEQRLWSPYKAHGYENGDAWFGTKGWIIGGKEAGWEQFGERNKPADKGEGRVQLPAHARNFLDCIQSGKRPNADVETHHFSACLCHLGNIATRLGRTLHFDPASERFLNDSEANRWVSREYRAGGHWAIPSGVADA